MKIYLTRHGKTPLNIAGKVNGEIDEPLAPEGIEQAKEIISTIPKSVKYIYSSPLIRAKKTADIIGKSLKIPVIVADELTEIKMGSLAGKSWEEMESGMELKKKHRTVQFDYKKFGGESLKDVTERISSFFKKINNKHPDFEILCVSHGGMIRVINKLEKDEAVYETEKHATLLEFDLDKILNNIQVK